MAEDIKYMQSATGIIIAISSMGSRRLGLGEYFKLVKDGKVGNVVTNLKKFHEAYADDLALLKTLHQKEKKKLQGEGQKGSPDAPQTSPDGSE